MYSQPTGAIVYFMSRFLTETQLCFLLLASSGPDQDQLKQRDQSLRKQEQEMDSLSFRNQQLAKRVELLQEELAVCEAKGKKGKVIQACVVLSGRAFPLTESV